MINGLVQVGCIVPNPTAPAIPESKIIINATFEYDSPKNY